jgi:hypothetical protein
MGHRPSDLDVKLVVATTGVEIPQQNELLTLANGTTYFAELGGSETGLSGVFWSWSTALVAAITYESTNLPPSDASVFVAAGRLWFPETGPGTLSIPGGAASCNMQHFADFGARRMRAKIVVTTGGAAQLRGRCHFKTAGG